MQCIYVILDVNVDDYVLTLLNSIKQQIILVTTNPLPAALEIKVIRSRNRITIHNSLSQHRPFFVDDKH